MQITYVGFPKAASIDVEARVQLVRLEKFSPHLHDCHLTIEVRKSPTGFTYDAQLDLLLRNNWLASMPRCSDSDPGQAIDAVFDSAVDALAHLNRRDDRYDNRSARRI